ncbi:MAG: hypothetical protein M1820_009707 [Bogoriella megaspora]|nr:MAG: hypothetical protein M1820_009707 [Bogoriella megaspora]
MSDTGNSSHRANQTGEGAGNAIKKAWGAIHGAGEEIRGNFNVFADKAGEVLGGKGDTAGKNQNIIDRGEREMKTGHYEGTAAGVTPADTKAELANREVQGEGRNHTT